MDAPNTAVVGLRPSPHVVAGRRSAPDEDSVFRWLLLNAEALLAYREGRIDTIQLGEMLKPAT